jgi:hypothetical protein
MAKFTLVMSSVRPTLLCRMAVAAGLAGLAALGACDASRDAPVAPSADAAVDGTTARVSIGGTVTGLAGSGLALQNNGGDDLAVERDGVFTFATRLEPGTAYEVTVAAQPENPAQRCVVEGGTGTADRDVTSVDVTCRSAQLVYESAVMGPPGQSAGHTIDIEQFIGVRFTTSHAHTITGLGVHAVALSGTYFIAVVPIDPATSLPTSTDLADAAGYAVGAFPASSDDVLFPTSFELPAGTWGLVVGSDRFGADGASGAAPANNRPVETPGYFLLGERGWFDAPFALDVRLFALGL